MSKEILLVVDVVSNEKGVEKEVIFDAIEAAIGLAAINAHYNRFDLDAPPGNGLEAFGTGDEPVVHRGRVPARSVVIPGSYTKKFPAGDYQVACALIIGQRKESTDRKTSLNDVLREHDLSV